MWVRSLGWDDHLEEGVATHSSILAWRIPWTEEHGRLQSMGSHRVRLNWSDLAHSTYTHILWVHFMYTDIKKNKFQKAKYGYSEVCWGEYEKFSATLGMLRTPLTSPCVSQAHGEDSRYPQSALRGPLLLSQRFLHPKPGGIRSYPLTPKLSVLSGVLLL